MTTIFVNLLKNTQTKCTFVRSYTKNREKDSRMIGG